MSFCLLSCCFVVLLLSYICFVHSGQRQLDDKLNPVQVVEPPKPDLPYAVCYRRRSSGLRYYFDPDAKPVPPKRTTSLNLPSENDIASRPLPPLPHEKRRASQETVRVTFDDYFCASAGARFEDPSSSHYSADQSQLNEKLNPVEVVESPKPELNTAAYCRRRTSDLRYLYQEGTSEAVESRRRTSSRNPPSGSDIALSHSFSPPVPRRAFQETARVSFDDKFWESTGARPKDRTPSYSYAGQRQINEKLYPVEVVESPKRELPYSAYCRRRSSGLRYLHQKGTSQTAEPRKRTSSLNLPSGSDIAPSYSSPPPVPRRAFQEKAKVSFDDKFWESTGARPKDHCSSSKKGRHRKSTTTTENAEHCHRSLPKDDVEQEKLNRDSELLPLVGILKHPSTKWESSSEHETLKNQCTSQFSDISDNPSSVDNSELDNTNTSLIIAKERSANVEHHYLHEDPRSAPHEDYRYTDKSASPRRRQLPSLERLDSPLPLTESLEDIHLWSGRRFSAEYYNERVRAYRLSRSRIADTISFKSKENLHSFEGFSSCERYSTPSISPESPLLPSFSRDWTTLSPGYYCRREDFNLPCPSTPSQRFDRRYWRTSSEERPVTSPTSSDRTLSSEYLFRRLSEDLSLTGSSTEPQHTYARDRRTYSDIQGYREQRSVVPLPTRYRAVSSDYLLKRRLRSGVKFYHNNTRI
ncbi:uncharacterized protein LOC113239203 [Hyposmocoma kahamanoa]|uniref:uncharacterized protein LOC113239203 n=1 Tax=Hyposmocoma kahamanoa TaxID=1477025 RepID=UPI000E6DA381|nr:uncharacterized protein LOC113239203 [Hyposmocoma kahamanoa]